MRIRTKKARGFTLIELMIVVAIVGVLAVLAIVGVRKYIASAKTAEATNQLGTIGDRAQQAYDGEGMSGAVLAQGTSTGILKQLCLGASATVPGAATSIKGKKYQSTVAEWNVDGAGNSGFACLHFTIDKPQYYMYNYVAAAPGNGAGASFVATANGDLNGDGVLSTFSLTGTVNASGALNQAPAVIPNNADE